MIFMTPTTSIADQFKRFFGMFESLGSYHNMFRHGFSSWCADNGRFHPTGLNPKWTEAKWLHMLDSYPPEMLPYCRFLLVPDVPFDAASTLVAFEQYLPEVAKRGYPPGFCTQNGMSVADIPWNHIEAIFIGGDNDHKLGHEGAMLGKEALRRGKWLHVGRVNSVNRMMKVWWADSCDGTTLALNPGLQRQCNLVRGITFCQAKKRNGRLL